MNKDFLYVHNTVFRALTDHMARNIKCGNLSESQLRMALELAVQIAFDPKVEPPT